MKISIKNRKKNILAFNQLKKDIQKKRNISQAFSSEKELREYLASLDTHSNLYSH